MRMLEVDTPDERQLLHKETTVREHESGIQTACLLICVPSVLMDSTALTTASVARLALACYLTRTLDVERRTLSVES